MSEENEKNIELTVDISHKGILEWINDGTDKNAYLSDVSAKITVVAVDCIIKVLSKIMNNDGDCGAALACLAGIVYGTKISHDFDIATTAYVEFLIENDSQHDLSKILGVPPDSESLCVALRREAVQCLAKTCDNRIQEWIEELKQLGLNDLSSIIRKPISEEM